MKSSKILIVILILALGTGCSAVAAAVAAAAAAPQRHSGPSPSPQRIRARALGDSAVYRYGTFTDNSTQNLTTSVNWTSSDLAVASSAMRRVPAALPPRSPRHNDDHGRVLGHLIRNHPDGDSVTLRSIIVSPANSSMVAGTINSLSPRNLFG